jgi:hypothetical protein
MQNDQAGMTRWVCWHPELGYLRFGSYSVAHASAAPDPRGCFTRRADAVVRQRGKFFCSNEPYWGSGVVVRRIRLTWEVLDGHDDE